MKSVNKLTVEMLQQALLEMKIEEPQFYKIADNLYCYRYKNASYIGTTEFFEQVDEEVKKIANEYYGRLQ